MDGAGQHSTNVMSIVQRIRPSLDTVREARGGVGDRAAFLRAAGRANVRMSVEHLRHVELLLAHPRAEDFLRRDVENLVRFFRKRGVKSADTDAALAWIKDGKPILKGLEAV